MGSEDTISVEEEEDFLPGEDEEARRLRKSAWGAQVAIRPAVVVGAVWWEKPGRRNDWVKLKHGAREGRRVLVTGYRLARLTPQLRERMQAEGRNWSGWSVRYSELEPGKRIVRRNALKRYLPEEEFRKRYQPAQVRGVDLG